MKWVAWLSTFLASTDPAPAPVLPHLPQVVVVHGLDGDPDHMARLTRALRAAGRQVFTPTLTPSNGAAPIEALSAQLDAYITTHTNGKPIDLIGYSMGGLITRHYLQRRGGLPKVHRYLTLSTPHHGTLAAFLHFRPGTRQMRPGSTFLADLNADADQLRSIPFTSFWTATDLLILPASSSKMPQATNIHQLGLGHFSFIIERRCIRQVIQALHPPQP